MEIQKLKANELRIGNYVIFNTNNKPFQITPAGILEVSQIEGKPSPYFYEAVPLTEDILLKCGKYIKWDAYGNENYGGYIDFIGDWKLMLRYWDGEFIFYVVTVNKKKGYYKSIKQIKLKIKYLHQLQNLVHSLTQKELTVQL